MFVAWPSTTLLEVAMVELTDDMMSLIRFERS